MTAATLTVTVAAVNDAPTVSIAAVGGGAGWRVAEDGVTAAGELSVASGDAADGRPGDVLTYTVAVSGGGAAAALAVDTGAGSASAAAGGERGPDDRVWRERGVGGAWCSRARAGTRRRCSGR